MLLCPRIHKKRSKKLSFSLVDRHPARCWSILEVRELSHVILLCGLLATNLALHDVGLQSFVKVVSTHDGVGDGEDDQHNGDGRETGQTLADGKVVIRFAGLVHAGELEDEVGQSAEEEEDGADHADLVLSAGPEGRHEQDQDRNGNGSDGEAPLKVRQAGDNDKELHRESQEEEEIKLEQRNVNLVMISNDPVMAGRVYRDDLLGK
jgi:hypothetical protein